MGFSGAFNIGTLLNGTLLPLQSMGDMLPHSTINQTNAIFRS